MTEAELPIAWLSADGVVRGAYGPPVRLALNGYQIDRGFGRSSAVTPDGQCVICVVAKLLAPMRRHSQVMAYSLSTGAELWRAPVPGDSIVGIASIGGGLAVWVANMMSNELPCTAYSVANGTAVLTLPLEEENLFELIATGPWKDHMLCHSRDHVTLYAPSADLVWQVASEEGLRLPGRILATRGEWFGLNGLENYGCRLYRLRDGQPVPSVLDSISGREAPVAVSDPAHALVCETLPPSTTYRQRFKAAGATGEVYLSTTNDATVLPPSGAVDVAVVVNYLECIRVVDPATAAVLDLRLAPGVVTAWHWPAVDCARRERDAIDAAIAVTGDCAGGLVRSVVVKLR